MDWQNSNYTFHWWAEIVCEGLAQKEGVVVDMEEQFCIVTFGIIGKAVLNCDFGSVTQNQEFPIIKAVCRVLLEVEYCTAFFISY